MIAIQYAERHTFIHGDPGIRLIGPETLKVRDTHSTIPFTFGCTDLAENYEDLPSIIKQVAEPKRPDPAILGQRRQDQNMPRVQQEDCFVESMWQMLPFLVL
jgi:hypothetical protein